MAVKAIALVISCEPVSGESKFRLSVYCCGVEGSYSVQGQVWTAALNPGALVTTIQDAVSDSVKDYLSSEHSVEFGAGDTVRVLSGLV